MDNNICSGPEITRKTLIDQLFISVIHVKQNFHVGLQKVICYEGIQSIYFSADTKPPFITLRIHNHFLPDFSRGCQNLRSSWSPCACFVSRHVFL